MLLAHTLTVCDGDVDLMIERASFMTWFEEWFIFYEFVWKKTATNLKGLMATFSTKRHRTITAIVNAKLHSVLAARTRWSKFAQRVNTRCPLGPEVSK